MNTNIKKYFTINKSDSKFKVLDEQGQALVECGLESVKKYIASISKSPDRKSFAEVLSDVNFEDRLDYDNEVTFKIVKYSAKKAGYDVTNFQLSDVRSIQNDQVFTKHFNAILAQILTPIVPAMISTEFMDMADVSNIGWGDTAVFKVKSNDQFYVSKIAEGVLQGSIQRIYNDEITVNPEPYNIKTTIDWYQVASGVFDLGDFVYRVGASFSAYITQMVVRGITDYVTTGFPTAYFANGMTTTTFTKLSEILRAANGGAKVKGYGTLSALSAVIPEGAAASKVANMQMQLGEEWSKMGYVGTYMDVDLVRIPQIVLPNTINSSPLIGIPDNTVWFFADGGYKPVKIVFEGSAISIDIIPTESPDKEMGINVTMRMGQTLIAASKFGAITGISL